MEIGTRAARDTVLARTALSASWLLTSVTGSAFIYSFWARNAPEQSAPRSIVFLLVMSLLHGIAFLVLRKQDHELKTGKRPASPVVPIADSESAHSGWPRCSESPAWMISWLAMSFTCFALAGRRFLAGHELQNRIIESGRTLDSVPPTMLSQHPALGVAMICVGFICALLAFRKTSITFH